MKVEKVEFEVDAACVGDADANLDDEGDWDERALRGGVIAAGEGVPLSTSE